ncbi:DUF2975 domain-containing protein [Cryobacterium sp. PH31-L1]|uniref:DUF2975 domain-containing protein n=1 Tax=Cryobacterium sp. PH31-L1 TaxID=3046199 RepID=UPI0024B9C154|nr:DUF2975 domain-containing protein [Cryobacterium sp. PH31-L1]MDJ0379226.1 DUF2975 domain-containing protein [Cryobacterium sp. PH31-L1]
MRRWISFALNALLLLLLVSFIFIQVWVLPHAVDNVVSVFPEVEPLAVPSFIWGVVAIACWQAVAVIGLRLVMLIRDHRFNSSSYGWLWAIIGCLLAFIVLVVSAFIALSVLGYTNPGVMYGLIAGGLVALIIVVSVMVFLGANSVIRPYLRG